MGGLGRIPFLENASKPKINFISYTIKKGTERCLFIYNYFYTFLFLNPAIPIANKLAPNVKTGTLLIAALGLFSTKLILA